MTSTLTILCSNCTNPNRLYVYVIARTQQAFGCASHAPTNTTAAAKMMASANVILSGDAEFFPVPDPGELLVSGPAKLPCGPMNGANELSGPVKPLEQSC